MAHLLRTWKDEVLVEGFNPSGADLIDIDEKTKVAINGDAGGLWTPSTQINIGGAGVIVAGPWSPASPNATVTGQITFAEESATDFFRLDTGHPEAAVTALHPLIEVYSEYPEQARGNVNSPLSTAIQPFYTGITMLVKGVRVLSPLRVRNSGRCTQVVFEWRVRETHAAIPATLPRFGAFAVDASGKVLPLRAKDATTDAEGFQFLPMPANAAAYNGSTSFTYTCNQNQIVDTSKYSYFAGYIEESGANAWATNGNFVTSTTASFDQITLLDGRA